MTAYDTARRILQKLPSAKLRPQSASDWTGDYELPSKVAEYFETLGPVDFWIEDYGNPYFLPSLSKLWSHQVGYRTHGFTGERLKDWDDDWLVIADQGGDPFIFSRNSTRILHAYHGEGVWEPTEIFENLSEMVTSFAILGDIAESAGRGLTDDDSLIQTRYRDAARSRIAEFTRSNARADEIVERLGWGAQ